MSITCGEWGRLAFARVSDNAWTIISRMWVFKPLWRSRITGKFYAIGRRDKVVVCDVEGPIPIEAQLVEAKPKSLCQITEGLCREDKQERFCIVGSLGALLVVSRKQRGLVGPVKPCSPTKYYPFAFL